VRGIGQQVADQLIELASIKIFKDTSLAHQNGCLDGWTVTEQAASEQVGK
jgi:hypothetical protein